MSVEAQAEFLSLAPADAGYMVFCVMIASPEDSAARESLLRTWMQRLSKLRGGTTTGTSIPFTPQPSVVARVNPQCVVAGTPSVVGAVVLGSV